MRYTKREQVNTMDDMSQLQRAVENHKIDGLILGRTLIRDDRIKYLKQTDLPFVAIGSTEESNVAQIDNDHIAACRELTSILIMKGMKKFALIGGDSNHVVNRTRREGFEQGITGAGLMIEDMKVYMDCVDRSNVEMAVEDSMRHMVDCIVCMDDGICNWVLDKLRKEGISVPEQICLLFITASCLKITARRSHHYSMPQKNLVKQPERHYFG